MVKWTKNLETGFDIIDVQHKELVDRINILLNATKNREGKEEIVETIEFLISYVDEHFGTEEKLMIKYNYPKYAEHKKLHDYFVEEVKQMLKDFLDKGGTSNLVVRLNGTLIKWLIDHIMKVDKELAKFFKEKGIVETEAVA